MKKILAVSLVFLVFLLSKHQLYAQTCTDFAVIVGNWGDASLQRFDGTTGNYSNQLATGIGARINSVLQYPSPNGNLYLGGYEEVNVVNAFTGAVSFSFTGGSLSGLTEQIVIGNDGLVYVASEGTGAGSGSIARYNATTGAFINNFLTFPSYQPNGLAQDAAGNWYVGTRNSPNEILKYNSSGVLQGVVATMGTTQIGGGLKVFNNELYVVTTDSPQTVKVYSLPVTSFPATPVRTLNTGGSTYVGIAFGPDNNMYMADFNNGRVSVWNPTTGTLVRNLTNSSIGNPHGVGFTTCTPCTPPTVGTAVATQATCTGSTANNDAKIDISGVSGGDKYSYGTDTTSFTYASATSFTGATISITGLANPSSATTYYVRVYNGSGLCVKTVSVVLQPKSCTAPSTSCVGNLMSNGSLENGTFSAATVDGVTTQVTTYGGSQSIFLPFNSGGTTGAGIMGHPVADFAANIGYWVDASTNTGTGSKDMNRLFAIPSGWGANRCLWPSGGSGFVYTKGNCYRMCFWVAQFDPTNPTNTSPSTFNFETYDHNGVATVAATATNFSVTPTSVNNSKINFTLPASTNVKTTSGAAYTGANGQVVDWKTLNWQYICFDLTPLVDNPKLDIYISTDGVQDNGLIIDGICAVENCTATCTKPTVGTATSTQSTCTGSTANSDAKIDIAGISGGDKYSYGTDSTTFTYASATAFTGASISITGLANPSTATTYYVRVYNGADACYKTVSVVLQPKTCITCPSTTYPLCAGESYTLSTPSGMTNVQWYKNGVAIAAPTGTATSLVATTIGDYVYTGLPSGGTCKDSLCCPVKIVVGTNCCTKPIVGTPVATQATCTGSTANSDAKIDVTGISGGDKYSYGTDSTTFTYASA
ncbi:MAG: hypothetical protein QE277_12150, partial [Flectobacillus sp.]|nr:hypothetical protein [Flectobacillus sp.]